MHLKRYRGQHLAIVACFTFGGGEVRDFVDSLTSALTDAGWVVSTPSDDSGCEGMSGLYDLASGNAAPRTLAAASALIEEFARFGFVKEPFRPQSLGNPPDDPKGQSPPFQVKEDDELIVRILPNPK